METKRSRSIRPFAITAGIVFGLFAAGVAVATRNSSGTYTLPAGNPVVSGTAISSTWANGTLGDLGTELTDSLSRSGKGAMLAPVRTPDGTVAAPAHAFSQETGTGLYRIGASDIGIAISGVKRAEVTASGVTIPDALTVAGTSGATLSGGDVILTKASIQAIAKTGANLNVGTLDANHLSLVTNNTVRWYVDKTDGSLNANAGTIAIHGVADPTNAQDAATKNYVDVTAGTALATNSALMRRDAAGRVAVAAPSASGDAATKGYVDGITDGFSGNAWASGGVWQSNWSNNAANDTRIYKHANGIVVLQMFATTVGTNHNIFTLPTGYRPAYTVSGVMFDASTGAAQGFSIVPGGLATAPAATVAAGNYFISATFSVN